MKNNVGSVRLAHTLRLSPSVLAITTAPQLSLQTLVAVRNMSGMRSTARISPTPSSGSPTAVRMMVIITSPAVGTPACTNQGHQITLPGDLLRHQSENAERRETDDEEGDLHHHVKNGIEKTGELCSWFRCHTRDEKTEEQGEQDDGQHFAILCHRREDVVGDEMDQSVLERMAGDVQFGFLPQVKVGTDAGPDYVDQYQSRHYGQDAGGEIINERFQSQTAQVAGIADIGYTADDGAEHQRHDDHLERT